MAGKEDKKEKKPGFLERNGFITSSKKEDVNEANIPTSNSSETEPAFVFDFTQAEEQTEVVVEKKTTPVAKVNKTSAPTNEIDPKIAEKLKKVLVDSNIPGPDYFEFKQQLDNLSDVISDEPTRYKAAYKSLPGITKEKITNSAQQYVGKLKAENNKFSEAISQKSNTDIKFKTEEARVLNTENINLQSQIEELQAKIVSNKQKINALGAEVQKAKNEIEDARRRFENTLNGFVAEIETNTEKATQYI